MHAHIHTHVCTHVIVITHVHTFIEGRTHTYTCTRIDSDKYQNPMHVCACISGTFLTPSDHLMEKVVNNSRLVRMLPLNLLLGEVCVSKATVAPTFGYAGNVETELQNYTRQESAVHILGAIPVRGPPRIDFQEPGPRGRLRPQGPNPVSHRRAPGQRSQSFYRKGEL